MHCLSSLACRSIASLALAACLGSLAGCGSVNSASGSEPGLSASVSATSLTFGSLTVGTTSAAQAVTVTAVNGSLALTGVSVTGPNAGAFAAASTCPASLSAGSTCSIAVTFTATSPGALSGTLAIMDNAGGSPQTVALSGTGAPLAAVAALSSGSIDFGSQTVGAATIAQTVTLSDTGNAALQVSSVGFLGSGSGSASGPFSLSGSCIAGVTISPGGSCTVVVSYAPTTAGAAAATVAIVDNAGSSPQTISVSGMALSQLSLSATVLAGSLPVSGATVQLYAAGTTGNGSGATALGPALTTDALGALTIPGAYNCPAATTQVYLVSRGGTVGAASGANGNLVMLSAIGPCSQITPGMKVVVDEATSVAGVVALAPFYAVGATIGASATNTTGLANAFATATELANPATGTSPGATLPGNVASPASRINTLANLVNACAVAASACGGLFSAATPSSGTAPTNTLDALYGIVRNPASNVAALYAASQASSAYSPALTSAPSDWTFFLTVSGAGMNGPSGLGVDSAGNVWVASYFSVASKFTPLGAAVFAGGVTGDGLNNSYGLAMDLKDDAWIPNEQPHSASGIGSVTEISSGGTALSGMPGFTAGGMDYPIAVAIDPNATVWVVDYGDSKLTLLNGSGTPLSGTSGYSSSLFAFPVAVAIDGNHYGWIANQGSNTVTKVAADGSSFTNYTCCDGASGLAIDQGNNVWVVNYSGSSVSLISNSGNVVSSGYTGGGVNHPEGIAIDGAGDAWVANYRAPYLTELARVSGGSPGTALTPTQGFGSDAKLLEAFGIAVDASGNVWVSNFGSNTVTKFLGLAVPVKTPLSGLPLLP